MKVLLIFRGENQRYRNGVHQPGYSGIINATDCVDNWNATLFDDLKSHGIDYNVMFITYPSPILHELIDRINPIKVITDGPIYQVGHLKTAGQLVEQEKNNYDRVVILRFDFQYRIRITQWPKWDSSGLFIVSRDVAWDFNKCYQDILFMFDTKSADMFNEALAHATIDGEYNNRIGSYLYHNNIPFELMYEYGYHIINHPLYALKHFDKEPDIDNPDPGIIINKFTAPSSNG